MTTISILTSYTNEMKSFKPNSEVQDISWREKFELIQCALSTPIKCSGFSGPCGPGRKRRYVIRFTKKVLDDIRNKDIVIDNTIYFDKTIQQFKCYQDGRWFTATKRVTYGEDFLQFEVPPSIELKSPIERLISNSVNIHQLPDEYNNLSSPINTNMI